MRKVFLALIASILFLSITFTPTANETAQAETSYYNSVKKDILQSSKTNRVVKASLNKSSGFWCKNFKSLASNL